MRSKSHDRLQALAQSALACFTDAGWKRTQVADVAKAAGVSAGSVYGYVAGKEGLFDLALRHASGVELDGADLPLPPRTIAEAVGARRDDIARLLSWPPLEAALRHPDAQPAEHALSEIIADAFARLSRHRGLIGLLDRCAPEMPELHHLHAERLKAPFLDTLANFLEAQARRGELRPGEPMAQARLILEMISWMAMHRHRDIVPHAFDDATALGAVKEMALNGLRPRADAP